MNKRQSTLLGDRSELFGFYYYPYPFEEAIKHHCNLEYKHEYRKNFELMKNFWKHIENYKKVWPEDAMGIHLIQSKPDESGTLTFVGFAVETLVVSTQSKKNRISLKQTYGGRMVGNIPIDFADPIQAVTLHFHHNLAEPLTVDCNLQVYQEPEIDYQTKYLENMSVHHATGEQVVNIYFQCSKEGIDQTEIELYRVFDRKNNQKIATYTVDKDQSFKSINGLAFGTYTYKVIQYEQDQKVVETDHIEFVIKEPNYSGRRYIQRH